MAIGAIQTKRVYDPLGREDGSHFLVERLWPRGIRKSELANAEWIKEAGPSTELREWFHHDPGLWAEFRKRYFAELESRLDALQPIFDAAHKGKVTLLYSSHDTEHNNAVALKEYLEHHLHHASARNH
ncbi:MAG: DUF488 family protein [Terracidiphilus sp.]|jgi:uncharacterized protein YeaO (DUF488 family)